VEIGAEAALFPEKEYINGIAVAVYAAHRTIQPSQEDQYTIQYMLTREGPVHQSASVLLNRVK
jgi:hypothetical protein